MVFMIKSLRKFIKTWTLSVVVFSVLGLFVHLLVIRHIILFVNDFTTMTKSLSKVLQQPNDLLYLFNDTKYVLVWTDYLLITDSILSQLNCSLKNCIVTKNRDLLGGDYTKFDAILFNDYNILNNIDDRPTRRNASQLYIFTSIESPATYPACELYNDNFFNWTFTNRLDSDVPWHYFIVRDFHGIFVAPSVNVDWKIYKKYPINDRIKEIVGGRSRAAAWIVSHCGAQSLRDSYMTRLQEHLYQYGLQIDVFGKCTQQSCGNYQECENYVRKHYYFYMAFENSFADDYVTEKVLHGYDNYVVPIVYGAANYTRFLPPGSYINAMNYHPYNLAGLMNELIKFPKRYEKYLQWTNIYIFQSKPSEYHPLCDLCVALNSEEAHHAPVIKNFRFWWNTLNGMKWCLPSGYWRETAINNIDGSHMMYRNSNVG